MRHWVIPIICALLAIAAHAAVQPLRTDATTQEAKVAAEAAGVQMVKTPDGGLLLSFPAGWTCFQSDLFVTGNRVKQVECFRIP